MLKKIIQTIVRWLKMTFNFNVGGLTPQDALPGGGADAAGDEPAGSTEQEETPDENTTDIQENTKATA